MDYVELSIGKIEYKDITYKHINRAEAIATLQGNEINNAVFCTVIERSVCKISNRKLNRLGVNDYKKLRSKTIEILVRYGLIEEEKETVATDNFSPVEKKQFNNMLEGQKNRLGL